MRKWKKICKRGAALFLTLTMCLSLVQFSVFAADTDADLKTVEFRLESAETDLTEQFMAKFMDLLRAEYEAGRIPGSDGTWSSSDTSVLSFEYSDDILAVQANAFGETIVTFTPAPPMLPTAETPVEELESTEAPVTPDVPDVGDVADAEGADAEEEPAEVEPAEEEPAEVEPAEVVPVEEEPAEVELAEEEPAEVEPAEVEPAEEEPAEVEPAEPPTVETPSEPTDDEQTIETVVLDFNDAAPKSTSISWKVVLEPSVEEDSDPANTRKDIPTNIVGDYYRNWWPVYWAFETQKDGIKNQEAVNAVKVTANDHELAFFSDDGQFGVKDLSNQPKEQQTRASNALADVKNGKTAAAGDLVNGGVHIECSSGYYIASYRLVCGRIDGGTRSNVPFPCGVATQAKVVQNNNGNYSIKKDYSVGANGRSKDGMYFGHGSGYINNKTRTWYPVSMPSTVDYQDDPGETKDNQGNWKLSDWSPYPFYLLLSVEQAKPPFLVSYDWGELKGELGNSFLPENESHSENNPTTTIQWPNQETLKQINNAKPGYTFAGWTADSPYSGSTYKQGDTVNLFANLHLHAKWQKTYTLTYHANYPEDSSEIKDEIKSASVPETSYTFTVADNKFFHPTNESGKELTFMGWNTLANGNGTYHTAGARIKLTAPSQMTGDLYAQWKETIPDLEVSKTAEPVTITAGGTVTYSITIKNNTEKDKTLYLGEQTGLYLDENFTGAAGSLGPLMLGEDPAGSSVTIPAKGSVTLTADYQTQNDDAGNTLSNTATVIDNTTGEEFSSEEIEVPVNNKDLIKAVKRIEHADGTVTTAPDEGGWTAVVGDTIVWTIQITNNTNETKGFTIDDPLMNTDKIVRVTPGAGESEVETPIEGNTVSIPAKGTAVVHVSHKVQSGDAGQKLINVVSVNSEEFTATSDPVDVLKPALSIEKELDNPGQTYHAGDTVSYKITVTNTGKADAANVVVQEIPAGITITSLTGGTWTSTDRITIASVPAGESVKVTVAGKIRDNVDQFSNTVKIVDPSDDGKTPEATAGPTDVTKIPYKLMYDANVPAEAVGTVTDMPEDKTSESTKTSCDFTVSNTIPKRDGYTFKGWKADDTLTVTGGRTITLTKDNPEKTLYAVWEKDVPELSITKKLVTQKETYYVGDQVVYEITVTNNGSADANNVVITEIPTGIAIGVATDVFGGKWDETDHTITIGKVPARGGSHTVTVTGTIVEKEFFNSAKAQCDEIEKPTDPTKPEGGKAEDPITVTKTAEMEKPGVLHAGDKVNYTITITNNTSEPKTVTFSDVFEGAVGQLENMKLGDASLSNNSELTIEAGKIVITAEYTATKTDVGHTLTNKAVVTLDGKPYESEVVTVNVQPDDLTVTKAVTSVKRGDNNVPQADGNWVAQLGDTITWTITITNNTYFTKTVSITDKAVGAVGWKESPSSVEVPGKGTAEVAGVTKVTVTHVVTEADLQKDVLTNAVTVTDEDETYDASSDPVTIQKSDLSVTKTLDNPDQTYHAGDPVSFKITVNNDGDADATDVQLQETPSGVTITGVTGEDVTWDETTNVITIAKVEAKGSVELTVTGTVEDVQVEDQTVFSNKVEITSDPEKPQSETTPEPVNPKTVTVTWLDGYSNDPVIKEVEINEGSNYTDKYPADPNRPGYTFIGWSNPDIDDDGNITITAQWTPNAPVEPETITYALSYNANGGTGAPAAESAETEDDSYSFTISTVEPIREGYKFLGWADGDAVYHGGDEIALSKSNPNKTVYAMWEKAEPANKLSGITKELVTAAGESNLPSSLDKPADVVYPLTGASVPVPAEGVTLLYKITVAGDKGAAYTVTDDGAVWIGGASTTGTIPDGGEAVIYVTRHFMRNNITTENTLINTATVTPGDNTKGPEKPETEAEVPAVVITSETTDSLSGIVKERLTSIPADLSVTGINTDETIQIGRDDSVTLLYRITVTGDEGVGYTVIDDGAVQVGGDPLTGKISEGGEAVIYVTRSFTRDEIVEGKVTNTASVVPTDPGTPGQDSDTAETDAEAVYTVTYTDGINGMSFGDDVHSNLAYGADTPAFDGGSQTRPGYLFTGWDRVPAPTVTDDATYVAQWTPDPSYESSTGSSGSGSGGGAGAWGGSGSSTPDSSNASDTPNMADIPDNLTPLAPTVPELPSIPSTPEMASIPETIDITEPETPLAELPGTDVPIIDLSDEDVPLADIPDEDVPLMDIPEEGIPTTDIPDENVPKSSVPKTGDRSGLWLWTALLSILGLTWLNLGGKKKQEDAE